MKDKKSSGVFAETTTLGFQLRPVRGTLGHLSDGLSQHVREVRMLVSAIPQTVHVVQLFYLLHELAMCAGRICSCN